MRRTLAPLLVGLLLVTAGCLGPAGPGTDTTNTTTTDDGTTTGGGATTTAPVDGPLAPGVAEDGSLNASALLDAHAAALVEAGAVIESNHSVGDGSRFDRRTVLAAGLDRLRTDGTRIADDTTYELAQWVNETAFVVRTTDGERTRYRGRERFPGRHHRSAALQRHQLEEILTGASFAVEGVTTEDGTRHVTLTSTGYDGEQYRNLSVELVVTGAGVLESLSASGTFDDGRQATFDYEVPRVGVESVERPAWVADAPPVVSARLSFDFVNCTRTYLRLVHEEGDPLPAGTTVELTANGTTHSVTLDERLPREGDRYIYLTDGGLRTAETKPSPADVRDIGNEVQAEVVTDGGLLVMSGSMAFGCESASEGSSSGSSSGSASGGSSSSSDGA